MKNYILIAVLATVVVAELFCCFKERQWRVAAESRLAEASANAARPQEENRELQAKIEALQTQIGLQQARLETIGKENREVLDKYVGTALRLKAAEAELAKTKSAARP